MQGASMTKTAAEMIAGFESSIAPLVNGGDFLQGFEHAISSHVTPVFNDQVGAMSRQQISMHPGTYSPKEVGVVSMLNGQSELNRMIQIFNGIENTTYYKGYEGEFDLSTDYQFNSKRTNGMQFRPMVDNANKWLDDLQIFDA